MVDAPVTLARSTNDAADDSPRDECGVIGLSTPHGDGVAQLAFFGLYALQHRGQEAAGIAVSDGQRARLHKENGLVSQVFTPDRLAPLTGYHAIGHTRYSTTGGSASRNAQPFLVESMHGPLAVAHNGNLVNALELRDAMYVCFCFNLISRLADALDFPMASRTNQLRTARFLQFMGYSMASLPG